MSERPGCQRHGAVDVRNLQCVIVAGLIGGCVVAKALGGYDRGGLVDESEQDSHHNYDEDHDGDYPAIETCFFRNWASYRCAWLGPSCQLPCQFLVAEPLRCRSLYLLYLVS